MSESQHSPSGLENRLIEIAVIVVLVVVGFLAFRTYLLRTMFPRATSSVNACINNLRQIDAAANQFALENRKTNGEAIRFPYDLTPYIKLNAAGKIPGCPMGGLYTINKVGDTPTCSIGTKLVPNHVLP